MLSIKDLTVNVNDKQILKGINLKIYAGALVAIVGQSGSGKSTLMNILGCLDKPTAGSYQVSGRETRLLEADELAQLRREYFGFIFQRTIREYFVVCFVGFYHSHQVINFSFGILIIIAQISFQKFYGS